MIITDKQIEYLQVKNNTIKPCKAKEKYRELFNNQVERFRIIMN